MNKKDQASYSFLTLIYKEKDIIMKYKEIIPTMKNDHLAAVCTLKNEHTKLFNKGLKAAGAKFDDLSNKFFVGVFFKGRESKTNYQIEDLLALSKKQCLSYEKILKNKYLSTEIKKVIRNEIIPTYFMIIDLCKEVNSQYPQKVKILSNHGHDNLMYA